MVDVENAKLLVNLLVKLAAVLQIKLAKTKNSGLKPQEAPLIQTALFSWKDKEKRYDTSIQIKWV